MVLQVDHILLDEDRERLVYLETSHLPLSVPLGYDGWVTGLVCSHPITIGARILQGQLHLRGAHVSRFDDPLQITIRILIKGAS